MNLPFSPIHPKSSQIRGQYYEAVSETLFLEFWNKKVYTYQPVSLEQHKDFLHSKSKGKYFHSNFKQNSKLKISQVTSKTQHHAN